MARIIKIKNNSGSEGTWVGQTILVGEYYQLNENEVGSWAGNAKVFADVGSGALVVNDGSADITDPIKGWNWVQGDILPYSRHLEGKLAVHSSAKPEPVGHSTYAVWAGCGDDLTQEDERLSIGGGELLSFNMTYGTPLVSKDVKFDPRHGRVWIHEAYLKFENGGVQDYLTADIIAPATPLLTGSPLPGSADYIVEDDWVKYSPGGPGTGTHMLAGMPVLMERPFDKDGDWDYDGVNLTPNFAGTGQYKITAAERVAHRYFNKVPLFGSSTTYFTMSSDETAELPISMGYFIRINVHNASNSNWNLSAIMEIYRERTTTCCPT